MTSPTVREQPTAYNTFRLDGQTSPGVSAIASGGDATEEIQDQRQMLTTGANSVVQYSKNAIITYTLTLWTIEHLRAWEAWESMFLAGRSKRPPRVYQFTDLRVGWVARVLFESMSPQGVDKPGGPWSRKLVLHQYNRVKPYGGPVKPGFLDGENKSVSAANEELRAQKAALNKQAGNVPPGKK